MSREDLEQFLTDEGRAKVEAFMAEAMAETARADQAEAEVERLKARLEFAWNEGDRLTNDLVGAVFGADARRDEF